MASRITLAEARRRLAEVKKMRSLQLDLLLAILRSIGEHGPIGYTALYQGIVRAMPEQLSNSTYYHMLAAGKILGLIQQESPKQPYMLTTAGVSLIAASQGAHKDALSDSDFGARLADIVRENQTLDHAFFWLFRGPDGSLPLDHGRAVYIEPVPPERSADNKRRQQRWVRSEFCGPIVLDTVLTQSLVFGLRLWCLAFGILDELVVAQSPDIRKDRVQVLFPVQNFERALTERSFENRLLTHFWALARKSANYWSVGVPELLHRLCPAENLGVDAVKAALIQWIGANRRYVVLSVFAPSVPMSVWQRKPSDYPTLLRSYLSVEGSYVSRLGLTDEIPERLQSRSMTPPRLPLAGGLD